MKFLLRGVFMMGAALGVRALLAEKKPAVSPDGHPVSPQTLDGAPEGDALPDDEVQAAKRLKGEHP